MTVKELVRKASDTCKAGDLEEALVIADEAVRLAATGVDESDTFDGFTTRAWLRTLASQIDAAREDLTAASTLLNQVSPRQQSRYYFTASELSNSFSEFIESCEHIEKAITVWPDIPPHLEAAYLLNLSRMLLNVGDYDRSTEIIEKGLALVYSKADYFTGKHEMWEKALLEAMGWVLVINHQPQEGIEVLLAALPFGQEGWQEVELTQGLKYLSNAYKQLGDFASATKYTEQSLDISRRFNLHEHVAICLSQLAEYALETDDPKEAARLAEEALSIPDRPPAAAVDNAVMYNTMMVAYARMGNRERAEWAYNNSRSYMPTPVMLLEYHHAAALYFEAIGDPASAFRELIEWKKEKQNVVSIECASRLNLLRVERQKHAAEVLRLRAEKAEGQLVMQASSLAAQTELLSHFREELRKIVRDVDEPLNALKKIKDKLKELPCESIDWLKFEKEFVAVHPEFRKKLMEKFPELTRQEIKMCQFARLGLKTHEMARLLCLSERTIDGHRNSLRKKLGLSAKENLTTYLHGLV